MLLTITLEIPENHRLSIPESVVQIHTAEGQRLQAALSANTWVGPGRTTSVSLEEPLHGYTRKKVFDQITLYGKTEHAYFFLVAEFPAVDADIVFLKPPIFFIDGSAVELDQLSFKKTLGTIVSAVNC